jgi:hypothetical protein
LEVTSGLLESRPEAQPRKGEEMKKLLAGLIVVAAVVLVMPTTLVAKDKKKQKVTEFSFEEDEVTVSFLKPEVGFVGLIQQEKAASLIKMRDDFVDEIVRSAENL